MRYVFEPDSLREEILPWTSTRRLGYFPSLQPGDRAPAYRLLWELAFAGGWPERSRVEPIRRVARSPRVPTRIRGWIETAAAKVALAAVPTHPVVLVKTVRAHLSTEWLAREFDPTMVVLWRHPLNLVPAWMERGWDVAGAVAAIPSVRGRLHGTEAWPPPEVAGVEAAAWVACAQTVILLESAARHPSWIVVNHERQCLDPLNTFRSLLDRVGLAEPDELGAELSETDADGSGYEIRRRTREEPGRWRHRLSADDQKVVLDVMRRFGAASPATEATWSIEEVMLPARDD